MRVFVAGATGAIGRPLLDRLQGAGHEVVAMTRSTERGAALRARGVDAAVCDAFDAAGVREAIAAAQPEVVIHQLTDIPAKLDPRHYARDLSSTARLRRETGPTFAAAARAAGARRIIGQSVSFMQRPEGPPVLDEAAPLWLDAPEPLTEGVRSADAFERALLDEDGIEGVILRYGFFYGPGTSYAPGGYNAEEVRRRRFPLVGSGAGLFSFIHIDDAAAATVRALDHGGAGTYHVTDDEPVAARDWIPAMAQAMGGKPPRHVPLWLAKLLIGALAGAMVEGRGASNAKAHEELGWTPTFPSYREGFPAVFSGSPESH